VALLKQSLAKRLLENYNMALVEVQKQQQELSELETALEESMPGSLQNFQKIYEERGGEQFRPDQSKVQCM
jgi:hypothetical protein